MSTEKVPRKFIDEDGGSLSPCCPGCGRDPCECDRLGLRRPAADDGVVRTFASGATRGTAAGKIDPEGSLSPLAVQRFCEYMLEHQDMPDGSRRSSDNWQKGFGLAVLFKSLWRHFLKVWRIHRGWDDAGPGDKDLEDALCGVVFNGMTYLHEHLAAKMGKGGAP